MKRFSLVMALVFLMALLRLTPAAQAAEGPIHLFVTFKSEVSLPHNAMAILKKAGGTVIQPLPAIGSAVVTTYDPATVESLRRNPAVLDVSVEHYVHAESPVTGPVALDERRAPLQNLAVGATDPTTASDLALQWVLHTIQAPAAWALGNTGHRRVAVALVETGIDYTHQELIRKVDLSRSVSFVPEETTFMAQNFPGVHPSADLHGVATNMAGLIACNSIRAACIAPNVHLIAVKAADRNRMFLPSAVIQGITYAALADADIIVTGLSNVFRTDDANDRAAIRGFRRAVKLAYQRGALVIANVTPPGYNADDPIHANEIILPAQLPLAVGVAALDRFDMHSDQSGLGASAVDISAPGGRFTGLTSFIEDAVVGPCSAFSFVTPNCRRPMASSPYRYSFFIGSIPATAVVAGVAALIDSSARGNLKADQIRARLYEAVDSVGPGGFDDFSGHGRVNAFLAVTNAP